MTSQIKHKIAVHKIAKSRAINIFVPEKIALKKWAEAGLLNLTNPVEVCLRIVNTPEIQRLNKTYRKKDMPTNVLSFSSELPNDIPQKNYYLGDVVLCADVIQEEAIEQNKTPEAHWAHMIIHGVLHLQGYDHIQEEDAITMETQETQLLETLGFTNPYEEKNND